MTFIRTKDPEKIMNFPDTSISTVVMRPGALGDTLMLVPALRQVKDPKGIAIVGRRPGIDFLDGIVGCVLDMEEAKWHLLFSEKPGAAGLPFSYADKVIGFISRHDAQIKSNLRFYYKKASIHLFSSLPPQGKKIHVAAHIARCLKQAGIDLAPEKAIKRAVEAPLLKGAEMKKGGDYYVIHPGSGSEKKNYSRGFFEQLLWKLGFLPLEPLLLFGPAEEHLAQYFRSKAKTKNVKMAICPDKNSLISIMENSRFFIGHDSGITHLSAMLGTPTIALFKITNVCNWRPLGPKVHVIEGLLEEDVLLAEVLRLAKEISTKK